MASGTTHRCALRKTLVALDIKCWGGNNNGQIGLGDTTNRGDFSGEMGDGLPAIDLGF